MIAIVPLTVLALAQAGPDIPPGINAPVLKAIYKVEEDLSKGAFDVARNDERLLPKNTITVGWDDKGVPQDLRQKFRSSMEAAIQQWGNVKELQIQLGQPADIGFTFVPQIAAMSPAQLPLAAADEFHESGLERLQVTLSMMRMGTRQTTPVDVYNEVAYAIGQYLGLERMPRYGTFSSRTDQSTALQIVPLAYEYNLTKRVLDISDRLRQMVESQTTVALRIPRIGFSTGDITGVSGSQDSPLQISFDVYNRGDAALKLFVLPDCSCLRPQSPPVIKPGEKGAIVANIDTNDYYGHLNHSLLVYSNDPSWPLDEIKVQMYVEPLFRFAQSKPGTIACGPSGVDADIYLIMSDHAQAHILTASVLGPKGTVDFQPWSGVLADDPESHGGALHGYKFHLRFNPSSVMGLVPGTLLLGTDSPRHREITYEFKLQKGIVADPTEVYFGKVNTKPIKMPFFVKSIGNSFRILRIVSDCPFVSGLCDSSRDASEHTVYATYNGTGIGDFSGILKLFTSDKHQPVIIVPVSGSVQ